MDVYALLHDLRAQRDQLKAIIAELEALQADAPSTKRRGRKFMTAAERQQVSERMRRYWASRRRAA